MPKPVLIPDGPLAATDADIARAEGFVAALAQVFKAGTSGGSVITEPFLLPDLSNPEIDPAQRPAVPLVLGTTKEQLYYRQIAHALALSLVRLASSTEVGVTKLNRDPADPANPVALNAEDVSVDPAPNKIPRANASGVIDSAWVGAGPGPTPAPDFTYDTECASNTVVGELVTQWTATQVRRASCLTPLRMPAFGVVISKSDAIHCTVQTSDVVSGIYSGLQPGKMYYVGADGKPTLFANLPAAYEEAPVYAQPVGFALTTTLLVLNPLTTTIKKG